MAAGFKGVVFAVAEFHAAGVDADFVAVFFGEGFSFG